MHVLYVCIYLLKCLHCLFDFPTNSHAFSIGKLLEKYFSIINLSFMCDTSIRVFKYICSPTLCVCIILFMSTDQRAQLCSGYLYNLCISLTNLSQLNRSTEKSHRRQSSQDQKQWNVKKCAFSPKTMLKYIIHLLIKIYF